MFTIFDLIVHHLTSSNIFFRHVLAGIVAFGIGCGKKGVPDVFASVQDALCFIDYDIKCKHGNDFLSHVDNKVHCSTWYDDTLTQLEGLTQSRSIRKYLRTFRALENSCINLIDIRSNFASST